MFNIVAFILIVLFVGGGYCIADGDVGPAFFLWGIGCYLVYVCAKSISKASREDDGKR